MEKKRHHYVPKAYLSFFQDEAGKLRVYLKDQPGKVLHQAPSNTAFQRYYYSQPLPDRGRENNALEDMFSSVESKWPGIVERVKARESINNSLEDVFTFMALQRVRVPALRDALETIDAETVKATARALDAAGKLPPKPVGHEDILDRIEVAIDPHRSIHGMVNVLGGLGKLFDLLGYGAIENRTDVPFLTSDNPVIWFDPSVEETKIRPYTVHPDGPVALLFPITPRLIIFGHKSLRQQFISTGFGFGEESDVDWVHTVNRHICRFAYEAVFAQSTGQEALIRSFAGISPVPRTQVARTKTGQLLIHSMEFGPRSRKPKWTP